MPREPKEKREQNREPAEDRSSWGDDQKRREYYYDDAHGYEPYDPESDDEED